jgi:hypothetical protein
MKTEDFADTSPKLDLFAYFEGQTEAWGLVEDRFGKVRRQFQVAIQGTIEGDTLTLEENFVYDDGEKEQRIWTIKRTSRDRYEGTAGDVVGKAVGVAKGNALNWRYKMDLKIADGTWRVDFDDWMFLQTGDVMINRAAISKWGIEVAQVTIFFNRPVIADEAA